MQTSVERKGKKSTGLNWYTLGPLLAAVAVAALMYLLAVLLERQILPYALVDELLIACVFLGAAIGGAAAAKKRGKSALASGLIAGAVLAALLAVGSMVAEAIEARDLLEKRGIHAALVNCRSVKPMDEKMLRQLANRPIVTMEEHVLTGGFGSVVCAFLSGEGLPAPMLSFGIPDTFVQHGRRDQLLKYLGLTPELMTQRIVIALKNGEKHQ